MTTIYIPDPSVVVLVAAAGTGKSTFAARHFAREEILSSDGFRAAISGDEGDQAVSRAAFAALHRALERRVSDGRLSVVDATNLSVRSRAEILRRARPPTIPAVALVFALPAALILARNASRRRRVDDEVVRRHIATVERLADGSTLTAEGFASVVILRSPDEVDAVEIVRVPAG